MSPPPAETPLTPDGRTLRDVFGFDLDADTWLARVRNVALTPTFGRLGPYEILGVVGRGGQGIVYKVRQPRTGRISALKRLGAGAFATSEMRTRFEREVEAAAALNHPNIVTVYGSEEVDDQLVLTMEWLDGEPFDRWAAPPERPRRGVREVLATFAVACDAIHHAHQRGVLHRDLKPSNILVDREGLPHVLDFGLAKFRPADSSSISLTETGAIVGTPAYASPELLSGSLRDIDVRCDVYALGAVLYTALTGRPPHIPVDDIVQFIAHVRDREPPAPASLDPRIDRELDAIIRKAMSKEKERRYDSISGLSEDIHRYTAGEVVTAHPPSVAYRLRKLLKLHRGAASAAAAFVAILLTATVVSAVYYFRAERELKSSELANKRQASLLQFVTDILQQADPGQAGKPDATIRSAVDRAREQFEQNASQYEPAVAAPLQQSLAGIYLSLGLPKEALPLAESSVRIFRELGPEGKPGLHDILIILGTALKEVGRLAEAEAALRESIVLGEQLAPDQPAPNANTVVQLLQILDARGDTAGALELARSQVERLRPVAATYAQPYALAINSLGLRVPNNPPDFEGVRIARESLTATEAAWGKQHRETAVVLSNLGKKLREAGQFDESLQRQREALAMFEAIDGPEHPGTMKLRLRLALVQIDLAQLTQAIENLNQVIAFRRVHDGDKSPAVAEALSGMAIAQIASGDFVAAEATCREIVAIRTESAGSRPVDVAVAQRSLADALKGQQRFSEAEPLLLQALGSIQNEPTKNEVELRTTLSRLVELYGVWAATVHDEELIKKGEAFRLRLNGSHAAAQP